MGNIIVDSEGNLKLADLRIQPPQPRWPLTIAVVPPHRFGGVPAVTLSGPEDELEVRLQTRNSHERDYDTIAKFSFNERGALVVEFREEMKE